MRHLVILLASLTCLYTASANVLDRLSDPHIAGGFEAVPHSHPHQVALFFDGTFFCGGSLISSRWVLTAGHCAKNKHSIHVAAGAHNLKVPNANTVLVPVQTIFIHEKYTLSPVIKSDIALLYLQYDISSFIDGKTIAPIRLPKVSEKSTTYRGSQVTLTGWGRLEDRITPPSDVLMSLNTTVLWNWNCKFRLFINFNGDEQLCTSGAGKIGGCFGDSGGPLSIIESDGKPTLIGVASYIADSFDCLNGGPTAFTRVTYFLDWIHTVSGLDLRP